MAYPTSGQLASQMSSLIQSWNVYTKQLRDWLAGTATGGPYGDGRYPLTDSYGTTFFVPCPAAQAARVNGLADSAQTFATEASVAALAAQTAKASAETARDITLSYRDAALNAKTLAETYANTAGSHAANAQASAIAAQAAAAEASVDLQALNEAVASADADRVAAEAAKVAAEAAAAAAASFDPSAYRKKTEGVPWDDLTGTMYLRDFMYTTGADFRIMADTTDETGHSRQIVINAGGIGGLSPARGAYLIVNGVNHPTSPGRAVLASGTGGGLTLSSAGNIYLTTATGVINADAPIAASKQISVNRATNTPDSGVDFVVANGSSGLRLHARLNAGSYNPLVGTDEAALIFTNAASGPGNTGTLTLAPWSDKAWGMKIRANGIHSMYGTLENYAGTAGSQWILRALGWSSNGIPRWKEVIEPDSTLSWYAYDVNGGAPTRLMNWIGAHMSTTPRALFNGEVTSITANGLRIAYGNYGAFFRNDGANFHLLFTASGDQYGGWNTMRPMSVNLASGSVGFGGNVTCNTLSPGELSNQGPIRSTGSTAVLHFRDRTTNADWGWYASAGYSRLWNGAADALTVDVGGSLTIAGAYFSGPAGRKALQISDTWLRLNPAGDFTSGIYSGAGTLRHDGLIDLSNNTNANILFVGGRRLSKITCSNAAPGALAVGELYLRYT